MSFGLVRGLFLRKLSHDIEDLDAQFQCRLFLLVKALIIGRSRRFIGALMRSLCTLPGGLGRLLPCRTGANHCRLRHIGWKKCGHGLTTRPRETSTVAFLNELLVLSRDLSTSAALLDDVLPSRCSAARFASKVPTWRLPAHGRVAERGGWHCSCGPLSWYWCGRPVGCWKRDRLNRKPPAPHVNQGFSGSPSRHRVLKRFRVCDHHDGAHVDAKRRCVHQQVEGSLPVYDRVGVG